jgi:hypothetical protein
MSENPISAPPSVEPSYAFASPSFAIPFGIDGLDDAGSDLISGGFYAIKVKTPSARFPLLLGALRNAVDLGLHCAVISGKSPEDFVQRLDAYGVLPVSDLVTEGKIHIFSIQEDFSKKMFRYTADRFVQELEEFDVRPGSLLIFDQADELISLHDVRIASEQLHILSKWFYRKQTVGLITLSLLSDQQMATLNSLMDYMTGIATLGGERDGLELTYLYWQSASGVAAARNYRLLPKEDGLYQATAPSAPVVEFRGDAQPMVAPSQMAMPSIAAGVNPAANQVQHFFYSEAGFEHVEAELDGVWLYASNTMDMLANAKGKSKAMLLLEHNALGDVWELAKNIHSLRKGLGTSAQIIVRETDAHLPDDELQMLLKCGANGVLGVDVDPADYAEFLSGFFGQIYPQRVNPNFAALIASFASDGLGTGTGTASASANAEAMRKPTGAPGPVGRSDYLDSPGVVVQEESAVPRVAYSYGGKAGATKPAAKTGGKAVRRSFATST